MTIEKNRDDNNDIQCCSFFSAGSICDCKEKNKEERRFSEDLLELSEHDDFFQDLNVKSAKYQSGLELWEIRTDDMRLTPDENESDGFEIRNLSLSHTYF